MSVELVRKLSADNPLDLEEVAKRIANGEVGALGFGSIFGIFGDIDKPEISDRIIAIKNRPQGKNLIATIAPKNLTKHVDFSKIPHTHEQIMRLQKELHAIGVILPASDTAPAHLVKEINGQKTILNIWTEYIPLRNVVEHVGKLGIRGLVGTSANKSGEGTHYLVQELVQDFGSELDFIVEADFSNLPENLRKSTSVIDLTKLSPRLHRLGNVPEEDIRKKLKELGFPELAVGEELIIVKGR